MNREDLKVGGVYKHCKHPLFIACTSLGEHGSLEGMALNNYNDIHQGDMCRSWFIPSFEPFDISFSLEQGECKEAIKGGDLNHWRKVDEDEFPEIDVPVLCKFMLGSMQPSIQYRVSTLLKSGRFSGEMDWASVIEWKPID